MSAKSNPVYKITLEFWRNGDRTMQRLMDIAHHFAGVYGTGPDRMEAIEFELVKASGLPFGAPYERGQS